MWHKTLITAFSTRTHYWSGLFLSGRSDDLGQMGGRRTRRRGISGSRSPNPESSMSRRAASKASRRTRAISSSSGMSFGSCMRRWSLREWIASASCCRSECDPLHRRWRLTDEAHLVTSIEANDLADKAQIDSPFYRVAFANGPIRFLTR